MKKCLIILACLVSISSFGQVNVGLKGTFQMVQFNDQGQNLQYYNISNINTIQAGITVEDNINQYFYLQTGLSYAPKGSFNGYSGLALGGTSATYKINYIQVPLNLLYKENINKSLKLLLSAGFYGAVGVSGTVNGIDQQNIGGNSVVNQNIKFTYDIGYNNNETYVKPIDFGYELSGGVEHKNFQFTLDYSRSFKTIFPIGTTNFRNQTLGISVGYLLFHKK